MFMGSAAKGLEATGAVPDLTAHEQEVLAAAQQAARAAATHRRSGGGAAAGGSKGYRGKDSATEPVAAEATAGGSAGDNGTAFRFFEEARWVVQRTCMPGSAGPACRQSRLLRPALTLSCAAAPLLPPPQRRRHPHHQGQQGRWPKPQAPRQHPAQ